MPQMCLEHQRRLKTISGSIVVIVVCDEGFAEGVEAVDLVEDVDFGDVGRGAETPGWRGGEGDGGVFVYSEDVGCGDGKDTVGGDAVPGCVDGGAWREAVDVVWV